MKRKIAFALLFLLPAQALSACAAGVAGISVEPGLELALAAETLAAPAELGAPMALALEGSGLYVAGEREGRPTLAELDIVTDTWVSFSLDQAAEAHVYGLAAADGGAWLLTGDGGSAGPYALLRCGPDGTAAALPCPETLSGHTLNGLLADGAGRLVCWDDSSAFLFDPEGGFQKELPLPAGRLYALSAAGGRLLAQVEQSGSMGVRFLDTDSGSWGAFSRCPAEPAYIPACASADDRFLFGDYQELALLDAGARTYTPQCSWLNAGVTDTLSLRCVARSRSGDLFACGKGTLLRLTAAASDPRTVLTLAVGPFDAGVGQLVTDFNKTNPDYRIETREYAQEDLLRLNTEILSGSGPDMVDTCSLFLARLPDGYFVDLLPLIDADPELARTDFLPNVLETLQQDGHLYRLYSACTVYTIAARSADVGTEMGWTVSDLQALLARKGDGYTAFEPGYSGEELLRWVCAFAASDSAYMDWAQGTCHLDSAGFIQWLELCGTCGHEEGRQPLLSVEPISNLLRPAVISRNLGGDVTYIGFPGGGGNGSLLDGGDTGLAITRAGQHTDGAWAFVRTALLPAHQNALAADRYAVGLPVRTDALRAALSGAVAEEDPDFTQADSDKLLALLETTTAWMNQDLTLVEIVEDEAAAYLAGDRAAPDTAAAIQSRVSLYMAEQAG